MTRDQFRAAVPGLSLSVANKWYGPVENSMFEFAIVSPERAAAFLATIGHESANLTRVVENLNYSAAGLLSTFGSKYFTPALAAQHARKPELIADHVYGGRMGNTAPGDGWKYRGRGLVQLTGKNNYAAASTALGVDLVASPEKLEDAPLAARASAWWWSENGCNELADTRGILAVSRRVNLGNANSTKTPNGMADRQSRYETALGVLG